MAQLQAQRDEFLAMYPSSNVRKSKDFLRKLKKIDEAILQAKYSDLSPQSEVSAISSIDEEVSETDIHPFTLPGKMSLDSVFDRDILLSSAVLNTSGRFILGPWQRYFENSVIKTKIANYQFFRGDLQLTFVFNTNQLNYGTFMAAYFPSPIEAMLDPQDDSRELILDRLSSTKHKIYFDVARSSKKILTLPFIYRRPYIEVMSTAPNITTQFLHLSSENFGTLYYGPLSPLVFPTNSVAPTIAIYAKLVNYEFHTPTALVPQSEIVDYAVNEARKMIPDEYATAGPVTQIASASSAIAAKLTQIPILGHYAKSTSMFLGKLAKAANIFGFSKPFNVDPIVPLKVMNFNNDALVSGKSAIQKIALDPKQELSIEPMTPCKEDELSYNYLSTQESYIGPVPYSLSSQETILALYPVYPIHFTMRTPNASEVAIQPTALSIVGALHNSWRGDLVFRIKPNFNVFHRGKVILFFEPSASVTTFIPNGNNYQYLWDPHEEGEIEVTIGFNSNSMWLRTYGTNVYNKPTTAGTFSTSWYATSSNFPFIRQLVTDEHATGVFGIYALENLSGQTSTNASFEVFVRGSNMQFNSPTSLINPGASVRPIGNPSLVAQSLTADMSSISKKKTVLMVPSTPITGNENLYHHGESITSFRQLLSREASYFNSTALLNQIKFAIYPFPAVTVVPM